MNDYAAFALGVVSAGLGGELFVRGSVGLARWARISPGIVGATVAAFATSSPELSVAVGSALAGTPEIALGNALGANVVNVALILGLALSLSPIHCPRHSVRRDFPVAVAVPLVTAALSWDGVLSRYDALLFLGLFSVWLATTVGEARRQRNAAETVLGEHRHGLAVAASLAGLAFLTAAGTLIVAGAKGIAIALGVDEFTVGATVVAVGTTVPELATTLIATLRGHDEVGLGTVLGSNIFNGLFIVAVAALIHPIAVPWLEMADALLFGLLALVLTYPGHSGRIGRRRAFLLLAVYAAYLAASLHAPAA